MYRKLAVVGIICLLMLVSLPTAIGHSDIEESNTKLVNNIPIRCRGTGLLFTLMNTYLELRQENNPITYFRLVYWNHNEVPVTITETYEFYKLDGTLLYESGWKNSEIPGRFQVNGYIDIQRDDLFDIGYLFGPFLIKVTFQIDEDNSEKSLLFFGCFCNYFAIIFNHWGLRTL